jgi:hypothetical protein
MAKIKSNRKGKASLPKKTQPKGTQQEQFVQAFPPGEIKNMKTFIQETMDEFKQLADNNMTASERRRKVGAGVRNYGFIDKASDLAISNPNLATLFNVLDLKNCIRNIEDCRDIVILLQTFARMVSNTMMLYSDEAYSMALLYYNSAKEMSRRGDPNAIEIFRTLQQFFHRTKHSATNPTIKDTEHNANALIEGTREGEMYVKNEKARTVGGKRVIIDKTRSNKDTFKETEEGEIE